MKFSLGYCAKAPNCLGKDKRRKRLDWQHWNLAAEEAVSLACSSTLAIQQTGSYPGKANVPLSSPLLAMLCLQNSTACEQTKLTRRKARVFAPATAFHTAWVPKECSPVPAWPLLPGGQGMFLVLGIRTNGPFAASAITACCNHFRSLPCSICNVSLSC